MSYRNNQLHYTKALTLNTKLICMNLFRVYRPTVIKIE